MTAPDLDAVRAMMEDGMGAKITVTRTVERVTTIEWSASQLEALLAKAAGVPEGVRASVNVHEYDGASVSWKIVEEETQDEDTQ